MFVLTAHCPWSLYCGLHHRKQSLFEKFSISLWVVPTTHKSKGPRQLELTTFSELCGSCPEQWGPTVSFWRTTFCPSFSLGCLVTSVGQTAQANVTHHWKLCLDTNGHLSLHTLHYCKYSLVRLPPVAEGSGWRDSQSDICTERV